MKDLIGGVMIIAFIGGVLYLVFKFGVVETPAKTRQRLQDEEAKTRRRLQEEEDAANRANDANRESRGLEPLSAEGKLLQKLVEQQTLTEQQVKAEVICRLAIGVAVGCFVYWLLSNY